MLEYLFKKSAGLKASNSIKKWPQHRCFLAKFAKFRRRLFLQKSSSGCFWGLTRVFKGVRNKSRCACQQQIPDSSEKGYLLLRKSRSSHRRCFVKEDLQGLPQVFSCECAEIFKNTYFEKHLWTAVSENQHLCDSLRKGGNSWILNFITVLNLLLS